MTRFAWFALLFPLLWAGAGCRPGSPGRGQRVDQAADRGDQFAWVAENLSRLDEIQGDQLAPQLIDRLNQWIHRQPPAGEFAPDLLIATMQLRLQQLLVLRSLPALEFTAEDAGFLQETVFLRDIAQNICRDSTDELGNSQKLFDWVVRHQQLEADDSPLWPAAVLVPRELLLFGRATAEQRAWLYILLLRQQGLDAVWLQLPATEQKQPRGWAVGVMIASQLYLFDPTLGLPIPGPENRPVATWAEVVGDDSLLRACDLDAEHPYGVSADAAKAAVAFVEGSPGYLSRRMKAVGSSLSGKGRLILAADAAAIAERVKAAGLNEARLWEMPYEVHINRVKVRDGKDPDAKKKVESQALLFSVDPRHDPAAVSRQGADAADEESQDFGKLFQGLSKMPLRNRGGSDQPATGASRQPLLSARQLEFRGQWTGERGARAYYQYVWLPPKRLDAMRDAKYPDAFIALMEQASSSAVYWLGLLALDEGQFDAAATYLGRLTLQSDGAEIWRGGARYNLALAHAGAGRTAEAVRLLLADRSPQQHGNGLLAKRLSAASAD